MICHEYETTVLLHAGWSADRVKKLGERIRKGVEDHGGTVLHCIDAGKRALAYAVQKETRAVYLFVDYIVDPKAVVELEQWLRYEEGVLRYMTVLVGRRVDVATRQAAAEADKKKFEQWFGNVGVAEPSPATAGAVREAAIA